MKYQIMKILGNCFQNINCFSWIKLIQVLIHLKYWYYNSPYLEIPCLPHHLCQNLPWPTETLLSTILVMLFVGFPFFLTHSTTSHHTYWIYQTICKVKPIKFSIKLYTDLNTLCIKRATHQRGEYLRADFLSRLDNTVNNNSIFDTKYVEFSTKW